MDFILFRHTRQCFRLFVISKTILESNLDSGIRYAVPLLSSQVPLQYFSVSAFDVLLALSPQLRERHGAFTLLPPNNE
jgi:hypothetical protein